jgi:hypothetical protein
VNRRDVRQVHAAATLGNWASSGPYQIRVRADNLSHLTRLEVAFADEIEAGTTEPSARRTLPVPLAQLVEDSFAELELTPVDVGGPTVAAVRTLRVEIDTDGQAEVSVWLDLLESASAAASPYVDDPGEVIQRGPDLIRFLLAELCDPPQTLDEALADTVAGQLGADVFGGDLRTLGDADFASTLTALAASTRSHVVPLDRVAGPTWGIYAADGDGTFAAPATTLTRWESLSREIGDQARPPSEWSLLYRWHASKALGRASAIEAYQGLERHVDAAAAARRGATPGEPVGMRGIYDAATAAEVRAALGPLVTSPLRTFRAQGVPHTESFRIELCDIVSLTLPADLGGGTIAARVVGLRRDFQTRTSDLVLAEVVT